MNINDYSHIMYFEPNNLTEEDILNLYIPDGYQDLILQITKYNGEYYYYKSVHRSEMIRELIGSALAKRIDLDTVDYKIGKKRVKSSFLYALSKIFFEEGFIYQNCYDFYGQRIIDRNFFRSYVYLNNSQILEKLKDYNTILKVLKLTALDLKMGQYDRHNQNLFLKIDQTGRVDLAPIFDYGGSYSYVLGTKIYDNPFLMIRKNKPSLYAFARKFPEIAEYASFFESIPIVDIFDDIEKEHMLELSDEERFYFQKMDQQNNKVLQKIIR